MENTENTENAENIPILEKPESSASIFMRMIKYQTSFPADPITTILPLYFSGWLDSQNSSVNNQDELIDKDIHDFLNWYANQLIVESCNIIQGNISFDFNLNTPREEMEAEIEYLENFQENSRKRINLLKTRLQI